MFAWLMVMYNVILINGSHCSWDIYFIGINNNVCYFLKRGTVSVKQSANFEEESFGVKKKDNCKGCYKCFQMSNS